MLNNRLEKFQDRRVRMALELAMDYEWMNRQLFRNSYKRVKGIFGNTDCEANGLPSPAEVALLEPFRARLPADVFGPWRCRRAPTSPNSLRANLLKARALLNEAGWQLRDGAMRNAKGEPLAVELLDTTESRSVTTTGRLEAGAREARHRAALPDRGLRAVPGAAGLVRVRDDRDLAFRARISRAPSTPTCSAARRPTPNGSGNFAGVKNPAVDALIARITGADNRGEFLAACRALDRVIAHGHYMVPAWTSSEQRVAYSAGNSSGPPPCRRIRRRACLHGLADDHLVGAPAADHVQVADMIAYIAKRILLMLPTLFGVLVSRSW